LKTDADTAAAWTAALTPTPRHGNRTPLKADDRDSPAAMDSPWVATTPR
jgi:hypothetical protein